MAVHAELAVVERTPQLAALAEPAGRTLGVAHFARRQVAGIAQDARAHVEIPAVAGSVAPFASQDARALEIVILDVRFGRHLCARSHRDRHGDHLDVGGQDVPVQKPRRGQGVRSRIELGHMVVLRHGLAVDEVDLVVPTLGARDLVQVVRRVVLRRMPAADRRVRRVFRVHEAVAAHADRRG